MTDFNLSNTLANIQSDLASRERTIEILRAQIDELTKQNTTSKKASNSGWVSNLEQQFHSLQLQRSQIESENKDLKSNSPRTPNEVLPKFLTGVTNYPVALKFHKS